MTTVITINQTDEQHLSTVIEQMRVMGAPTVRGIRDEAHGMIVALEGSHRIAAAKALGLAPIIVMLEDDDMILCSDIGFDDCGWFDGEPARAADIRERIGSPMGTYPSCPMIDFAEIVVA